MGLDNKALESGAKSLVVQLTLIGLLYEENQGQISPP